MSRFVGVCVGLGVGSQWGDEDQSGVLLEETEAGWVIAGGHVSSSVPFAEQDIARHYERRAEPSPADTYEWVGKLEPDEIERRFPPAAAS